VAVDFLRTLWDITGTMAGELRINNAGFGEDVFFSMIDPLQMGNL
jgi:hypothetical protein